jgi:hypothetical protein
MMSGFVDKGENADFCDIKGGKMDFFLFSHLLAALHGYPQPQT